MVFEFVKKYRDVLYLIVGLTLLVFLIRTCNKPVDLGLELEIQSLELKNKNLEKNIKLIDDSLKEVRGKLDSISNIEEKVEERKDKIITKGNEELKNIYSKSDSATHDLFTRYLAREDSIYKGYLPRINIIPREVN